MDWSQGGEGPPTQGVKEVFAEQLKELDALEGELNGLIDKDLAALNQTAAGIVVPGIYVPAK